MQLGASTHIAIPYPALVVVVGVSGAGKTTFCRSYFRPTEVVSSDECRATICDDESNQQVTKDAFDLLVTIVRMRLSNRRLVVIDATNVQQHARARLLRIAREESVPALAVVIDTPGHVCRSRNAARPNRNIPAPVIRRQRQHLTQSLTPGTLESEGFAAVYVLNDTERVVVERVQSAGE